MADFKLYDFDTEFSQYLQQWYEKNFGRFRTYDDMEDCVPDVYQEFLDGGAVPVVERVSDRGAKNSAKNPLLTLWMELNRDALAYWRELGLTPSGLKRLNESAMAGAKEQSALEKALASMT